MGQASSFQLLPLDVRPIMTKVWDKFSQRQRPSAATVSPNQEKEEHKQEEQVQVERKLEPIQKNRILYQSDTLTIEALD